MRDNLRVAGSIALFLYQFKVPWSNFGFIWGIWGSSVPNRGLGGRIRRLSGLFVVRPKVCSVLDCVVTSGVWFPLQPAPLSAVLM